MPTLLTSRAQIERKIDLAYSRKEKLFRKLDEANCDYELMSEDTTLEQRRKAKEAIDKIDRAILRIENVRLPKLKAKLAEFLTVPLGESQMVEGLDEGEVRL
jgi:hypothetical protein